MAIDERYKRDLRALDEKYALRSESAHAHELATLEEWYAEKLSQLQERHEAALYNQALTGGRK